MNAKVNLIEDIERIVDNAKNDYTYADESKSKRLRGIDDNRRIEKHINRVEEAFEVGEEIVIKDKGSSVDGESFNNKVLEELALLKKKQMERR
ncbi:MAG: hypothetical protein IJH34_17210 [Romboutsia sp.]|nr:hypothetical protein [Romboutsia sp.]